MTIELHDLLQSFMEYFIVTKIVAENGIIGYNKVGQQ